MNELLKMNDKKARLRFTHEDDILLLREFININPIKNSEGWNQIQEHLEISTKKCFQIRTLKNHLMLLLEMFLKKIKDEEIRSGVEEAFSEKDRLLEEVRSLCQETNYSFKQPRKKTGLSKEQQLCELGKKARNMFAADFYSLEEEEENCTYSEPTSEPNKSPHIEDHVENKPAECNEVLMEETNPEIYVPEETVALQNISTQNISTTILSITPKESLISLPSTSNLASKQSLPSKENLPMSTPNRKTSKNVIVPTRRRMKPREPIRKNALAYLNDKFEKENANKKRELDLQDRTIVIEEKKIKMEEKELILKENVQERKLVLEEKRFDLEYKERMDKLNLEKQKIEMDLIEKRIIQQTLLAQQQLINDLLAANNNTK